jgi:nitrile hydratase accessory protein
VTDDSAVDRAVTTAAETGGPVEDGDPTFDAPWQARAFATVVSLHRQGRFEWNEFQARLVETVQAADDDAAVSLDEASETDYYEHWLTAAESLLREKGLLDDAELAARTAEFERGERDASEFVVGVDHAHSHDHDH